MSQTKYLIVQEWIKNEINKGTYPDGEKIPSENELMERFGFSRQTVRLAIKNLESTGYLEKVKGSGTYVRMRKNAEETDGHNVGVVLRHLDYYIYPEIIKGIENALMQNGYTMTLGITHNDPDKEMSVLRSMSFKKLDGIIAEPSKTAMPMPVKDVYSELSQRLPVLFLGGCYQGLDIPVVSLDHLGSAKTATEYLIKMGHKHIGAMLLSDEISGHMRYEGFTRTLIEHHLPVNERNVFWYGSDTSEALVASMFKQVYFSGLNRCSAILCQDDKAAELCINTLKQLNLKSFDDVSVISFDNSATAEMLGLTSVKLNKGELGAEAAELLLTQIQTGKKKGALLKGELAIRRSVKKRSFSNSWDSNADLFDAN